MSDPDVLLRGLFAAGDAGDLDSFGRYLHEDVVVHAPAGLSTVGLENERESWRKAKLAIPDLRHEFIDILSRPGVVAGRAVVSGTMYGSYGGLSAQGKSFKADQAVFAHVRDDKIASLWGMSTLPLSARSWGSLLSRGPGRRGQGRSTDHPAACSTDL